MKKTSAKNLEARFDSGKSVLDYFDTAIQRINLDLPKWAIQAIDHEANRRGIARQALIKHWLIDQVDSLKKKTG